MLTDDLLEEALFVSLYLQLYILSLTRLRISRRDFINVEMVSIFLTYAYM